MKGLSNLTTEELLTIALEMNWGVCKKDGVPTVVAEVEYPDHKKWIRISDKEAPTARDALLSAVCRATKVIWLNKNIQESSTFVELMGGKA